MLQGFTILSLTDAATPSIPPGEGYSRQFRVGVCRQGSQTLTLFKGRKSKIDTLVKAQNQEMAPYFTATQAINVLLKSLC